MVKSKVEKSVTLIPVNTSLEGTIRFSGELFVNGSVVGDIEGSEDSQSALVVGEEGSVKGEIRVPNVVIDGVVEGDVHADARLELVKNARVRGDLHYKLIEVQGGAFIDGRMVPRERVAENVHELPLGSRDDDGSVG